VHFYRLRSGGFRAYYRILGCEVVVLAVTRRKDSDKRLKQIAERAEPGVRRISAFPEGRRL